MKCRSQDEEKEKEVSSEDHITYQVAPTFNPIVLINQQLLMMHLYALSRVLFLYCKLHGMCLSIHFKVMYQPYVVDLLFILESLLN